jgi:hypothetical protein
VERIFGFTPKTRGGANPSFITPKANRCASAGFREWRGFSDSLRKPEEGKPLLYNPEGEPVRQRRL